MTTTTIERHTATILLPLLYYMPFDTVWPVAQPTDQYGKYKDAVDTLLAVHRNANEAMATGAQVDPWASAQAVWEGYRTNADVGGLDKEIRTLVGAFDLEPAPRVNISEDAKRRIAELEKPAPKRLWLNDDEIELLQPPEFLIKDIIADKVTTVVYGPPDAGKTFVVVDMAMRVSQYMPVMYCAGEDGAGVKIRRSAWRKFYGKEKNYNFMMWNEPINLMDKSEVELFIEQVRPTGARMIVFDTLRQVSTGADENSSKDMGIFFKGCDRINREVGCASVVLHHSTKAGTSWSGTGAIKGNTYGMLRVDREDADIVLECDRVKNTRGFERRVFRLVDVQDTESCVIQPAVRVVPSDVLGRNQFIILESIGTICGTNGKAGATEVQRYVSLEGNKFYKPLKTLKDRGYIEPAGDGRSPGWKITELGRDYLNHDYVRTRPKGTDMPNVVDVFEVVFNGSVIVEPQPSRIPEGYGAVELIKLTTVDDGSVMPNEQLTMTEVDQKLTTQLPSPLSIREGGGSRKEEDGEPDMEFLRSAFLKQDMASIYKHCRDCGVDKDVILDMLEFENPSPYTTQEDV